MNDMANKVAAPDVDVARRRALGTGALAMAGGLLGSAMLAGSASAEGVPQDRLALIGMWEIIVEFPDGTKNPTLILFTQNGSVVETNALTKATGLGEWTHVEGRQFDYVFWEQFFDENNTLVSNIRVHHMPVLSDDGLSFDAEGEGTIFDLEGKQIGEVATKITGRRLS